MKRGRKAPFKNQNMGIPIIIAIPVALIVIAGSMLTHIIKEWAKFKKEQIKK